MGQSKASNESDYVNLQIRNEGDSDTFKVQGAGTPANRDYGVADVVTVNPGYGIGSYVKSLEATAPSLAGSSGASTKYVPVQAAIRQNLIHFQLTGPAFSADNPNELSREYGAIFNIPVTEAPALADFVHNNSTGHNNGGDFLGTDDDDSTNDDSTWADGPSTYKPDNNTGKCSCDQCNDTTNSDGSPKTVVIKGITYNITPIE